MAWPIALLVSPMIVDWGLQKAGVIPSTNFRRVLTGTGFGVALGVAYAVKVLSFF